MAVTPFIKPIPNNKGIMYTMQSALNDMTTSFSHDSKRFRMSKFALINIPSLQVPNADGDNALQINSAGDHMIYDGTNIYSSDLTKRLTESFQNYCLNLEALLLSRPGYNSSEMRTVSERAFWKWMKETGAVRFRMANALELDNNVLPGGIRFVEEDETPSGTGYAYNRVVKYVADIEVVNTVQNNNAYTEFFIYIPSDVGSTPYVMFDSVSSDNYHLVGPNEANTQYPNNHTYRNVTANSLDEAYCVGRHYDDSHPLLLDIHAYYDYQFDDTLVTWEMTDPTYGAIPIGSVSTTNYWFEDPSMNAYAYYTDNMIDVNGTDIGDCRNRKITRTKQGGGSVSFVRSNLDGIVIDFDKTHYKTINENPALNVFTDFNKTNGSTDFSYNAILLYYELSDPSDSTVAVTTNLFGIQFLSKPIQNGTYWKLPSIDKAIPDVFHKVNGNSFAHKVNLKFDTSVEGAAHEKSINDYNTFSLDLYVDALTAMRDMTNVYNNNLTYLTSVVNETRAIKDLMINSTNSQELALRIGNLEQSYIANGALFDNTNNVIGMIEQLYSMYNNIINNNSSISIDYNFDPMTLNNMIVLNQQYNWKSQQTDNIDNLISVPTTKVLTLSKYTNYFKHAKYTGMPAVASDILLTANVDVYINDSAVAWETGQSFDISFETRIDVGSFAIRIYTDANNKVNTGTYGVLIVSMDAGYFNTVNDKKPFVRITCIDKTNLLFTIDKIR